MTRKTRRPVKQLYRIFLRSQHWTVCLEKNVNDDTCHDECSVTDYQESPGERLETVLRVDLSSYPKRSEWHIERRLMAILYERSKF